MQEEHRKYGLLTSIAMIIGIVIGSGIFFKADDILSLTQGNAAIGCLVLIVGAGGIIFGGITIAEWAKLTDDAGGLISYGEKAYGTTFAFLLGWFQMVVYYPALIAVVCWIAAVYTQQLFPQVSFISHHLWGLAVFYMCALYFINTFAPRIAGHLQTTAMTVKLIPLLIIGVVGVLFGSTETLQLSSVSGAGIAASSSALVAAAFSYDGWSVAPSICHEIKNAKRNLPIALCAAPVIILFVYVIYFLGMVYLLGTEQIMELQDGAFQAAAQKLVGPIGARFLLAGVVVSVLGTGNGIILGSCRVPRSLACRDELPFRRWLTHIHPVFDVSVFSHFVSFLFSSGWLFLHYLSLEHPFVQQFYVDISGLPIVIMYVFYFLLYVGVMRHSYMKKERSCLIGYLCPCLACIGAAVVIFGGLFSAHGLLYIVISAISLFSGYGMLCGMKLCRRRDRKRSASGYTGNAEKLER